MITRTLYDIHRSGKYILVDVKWGNIPRHKRVEDTLATYNLQGLRLGICTFQMDIWVIIINRKINMDSYDHKYIFHCTYQNIVYFYWEFCNSVTSFVKCFDNYKKKII